MLVCLLICLFYPCADLGLLDNYSNCITFINDTFFRFEKALLSTLTSVETAASKPRNVINALCEFLKKNRMFGKFFLVI